ncbi:aminopeptidase P family protein [candidate division KSB1 bacterium]|nr:aminopeptidase P family protein [candidate division KSB1 bacterium]
MTLIQEKVDQAKSLLKELGIDCWITFARESELNGDPTLELISGMSVTWHSAFIVTAAGESVAIVGRYDQAGVEDIGAYDEVISYDEGMKSLLQERLKRIDPESIAINYSRDSEISDGLTYGMFLTLQEWLTEIGMARRLVSAEPIISALRQRKTAAEIEALRHAISHTEVIFEKLTRFIRPGVSECAIADFMQDEAKQAGLELAWEPATCPEVFAGPDTAEAHYNPTHRVVMPGHLVTVDFGIRYEGYCSDMQRTFYVLRPGEHVPPDAVQRGFYAIIESIELSRQALKPCVLGYEVDAVARNHLKNNGYPGFPHALGHQVGRFVHDGTAILGPTWEKYAHKPFHPIEPGMVFTLEPRVRIPEHGLVTIEEIVLVHEKGARFLTNPQKTLIEIEPY